MLYKFTFVFMNFFSKGNFPTDPSFMKLLAVLLLTAVSPNRSVFELYAKYAGKFSGGLYYAINMG